MVSELPPLSCKGIELTRPLCGTNYIIGFDFHFLHVIFFS